MSRNKRWCRAKKKKKWQVKFCTVKPQEERPKSNRKHFSRPPNHREAGHEYRFQTGLPSNQVGSPHWSAPRLTSLPKFISLGVWKYGVLSGTVQIPGMAGMAIIASNPKGEEKRRQKGEFYLILKYATCTCEKKKNPNKQNKQRKKRNTVSSFKKQPALDLCFTALGPKCIDYNNDKRDSHLPT